MSRFIKLSQNKYTIVDDDDYDSLIRVKWHARVGKYTVYVERNYKILNGKQGKIRMHRIIMGAEGKVDVDHKNHNGLDNRKGNLRICSRTNNMGNKRKYINGVTSKYKGVSFHTRDQNWRAQISINKKVVYIGGYATEQEAVLAYNKRAKEVFGEFAYLKPRS